MQELNIVELIEKNPITKLSSTYNNKLLNKIKNNFSSFEQQIFVSSFYCYLNYDKNIDFVVDLDDIWKWLGFTQKVSAIRVLEKNFNLNLDYKTALQFGKASLETHIKQNGGQNKQTILLTIKCFKSLCLKAQTKKASEIHEYYIKLEETLHEIVEEETNELKLQL
jgi:phage anti-repressor protein